MNPIKIEICRKEDTDKVMDFLGEYYRPGHVLSVNKKVFHEQYFNPTSGTYNIVVAKSCDSEIFGMLGYIETKKFDSSLESENSLWLATWQVNPNTRIPSLGIMLLNYLRRNNKHKSIAVAGVNPKHDRMYKAMGFKVIKFRHHYIPNLTINDFKIAHLPKLERVTSKDHDEYRFELANPTTFLEEAPQLHLSYEPRKSARYFLSRYLCNPLYEYQVYFAKRGAKNIGYIATRLVPLKEGKVIRLVDMQLSFELIPYYRSAFQRLVIENDCEYIDLLQVGVPAKMLQESGFMEVDKDSEEIIPNHLDPIVKINNFVTICYKNQNMENFVAFKADGDQDRPNR
ncbi:MAG: hypothetical protein AB8G05_16780 [Oligoflexales bacterium]